MQRWGKRGKSWKDEAFIEQSKARAHRRKDIVGAHTCQLLKKDSMTLKNRCCGAFKHPSKAGSLLLERVVSN